MTILDGSAVDEFRSTILARHIEAEEAFVSGDPRPRMELWSKRDPVTLLWFERFDGSIAGRAAVPVTVHATHVYGREDGEWKVVHRHADNPGTDARSKEDEDE